MVFFNLPRLCFLQKHTYYVVRTQNILGTNTVRTAKSIQNILEVDTSPTSMKKSPRVAEAVTYPFNLLSFFLKPTLASDSHLVEATVLK